MPKLLIVSVALSLCLNARADIFVDVPGCYLFQGQISRLESSRAWLKIFAGAGAEQTIEVRLLGGPHSLFRHATVEMIALVESKGALELASIKASVARVTPISTKQLNPRRVGLWKGYPKNGVCP